MEAAEVRVIVDWLESEGVIYQVNGGWAVDALVGHQTRPHDDLDVFLDALRLGAAVDWLVSRGYEVVADQLPVRIELRHGSSAVDLHPMVLDADGNGVQQGFDTVFHHPAAARTTGWVDGRSVVVATADRLIELRAGYPPRAQDRHDLAMLAALGGGRA